MSPVISTISSKRRCLVIVFACLMDTVYTADYNDSVAMPTDVYDLCPFTNICGRSASLPKDIDIITNQPCCKSCSCESDCGLSLNCCFEHQDKYNLVDKLRLACITPSKKGKSLFLLPDYSYFMVDRCLNDTKCTSLHVSSDLGGLQGEDTNDTGHIAPVSSSVTGFIYVNTECAVCNGIHSYERWTLNIKCPIDIIDSYSWMLQWGITHENCSFGYLPPPEAEYVHSKHCYPNIYDKCAVQNSPSEEACLHLKAPFYAYGNVYANVYCARCSKRYINGDTPRKICKNVGKSYENNLDFIVVLKFEINPSDLMVLTKDRSSYIPDVGGKCLPEEAPHPVKNECRFLYCPDGMTRTQTGCRYFSIHWQANYFTLMLELLPDQGQDVMMSYLTEMSDKQRNTIKSWLQIPCFKIRWTLVRVYQLSTKRSNNETVIKSLLIRMFKDTKKTRGFNPDNTFAQLQKCVSDKWTIELGGQIFYFNAKHFKYKRFVQDGVMKREGELSTPPKLYDLIAQHSTQMPSKVSLLGMSIGKLHFCQQVHLSELEVEEMYSEIRIRSNDIVLGDNEYFKNSMFAVVHGMEKINTTFAICIEDFNYQWYRDNLMNGAVRSTSNIGCGDIHLAVYDFGWIVIVASPFLFI